MSVVDFNLVHAISGGTGADGEFSAQLLFRATTNDKNDDWYTVLSDSRCPQRGAAYTCGNTTLPYLFAQTRRAELRSAANDRLNWDVTIDYSTKANTVDPEQQKGDPLDWRPICSTFSQKVRRPWLKDVNGDMAQSSAGEPYDPVQERDETKFGIKIIRNVPFSDPAFNARYRDAINLDQFWGCPMLTVKVEVPGTAEELYSASGQVYYRETWEFAINTEEWVTKLYDYGMYKINDGKRKIIKDEDGNQITAPVPLDGAGGVLPVGDDLVLLDTLYPYRPLPFAPLRLPNSFGDFRR